MKFAITTARRPRRSATPGAVSARGCLALPHRDLRRPVKGRDNYLFAGSPRGADAAAVYYTLVGTCLLQGIDPKRYLSEIAGRLDETAARLTPQAVRERWEAARAGPAADG